MYQLIGNKVEIPQSTSNLNTTLLWVFHFFKKKKILNCCSSEQFVQKVIFCPVTRLDIVDFKCSVWNLKYFLSYIFPPVSCCPAVLSSNHREALLDKESEMSSMLEKLRLKEVEIHRMREDEAQRASYLQSAILTYVQGSPLGHYGSPKKWPRDLNPSAVTSKPSLGSCTGQDPMCRTI